MVFAAVRKNKAYFKRFQTARRRRREGKTDYQQRINLVKQDKNKYNSPKYRLIVRCTNTKIIAQVAYATLSGDRIVAQAMSTDLKAYGVKVGLTNYSAAYCTGLLCARRALKVFGLDKTFTGVDKCDGEEYHVEEEESERRPLKVILDIGLKRTTVGANIFGALKGAVDGGLHVPHSSRRFPGYKKAEGKDAEDEYDAEAHKERILGGHVCDYMKSLQEEDPEKFKLQFSEYIKAGINADDLEAMYEKAHAAIRAKPDAPAKKAAPPKPVRKGDKVFTKKGSYVRKQRRSHKDRKAKVEQKKAAAVARMTRE
jgi:large subunit ribosomal protein L5e